MFDFAGLSGILVKDPWSLIDNFWGGSLAEVVVSLLVMQKVAGSIPSKSTLNRRHGGFQQKAKGKATTDEAS